MCHFRRFSPRYELRAATGYGNRCPKQEDGSLFPRPHYKGMYNCAGNDVYCTGIATEGSEAYCDGIAVPEENQTHIFWSMAYITPCGLQPNQSPHARPGDGALTAVTVAGGGWTLCSSRRPSSRMWASRW